ncbi:hypothetical protein ACFPPD_25165 [Cohnella suwonensis]|uniref:Uncharacterized protein n=1 Tax=Cohnella suwonensis TaxID=696072 RepID=A0ABW0M1D7_9BACL
MCLDGFCVSERLPGVWQEKSENARWARKSIRQLIGDMKRVAGGESELGLMLDLIIEDSDIPAIAVMACKPNDYLGENIGLLDFRGESRAWASFILQHRYRGEPGVCSCGDDHPQIVCGPMADNNTGDIIDEFRKSNRKLYSKSDFDWFWENAAVGRSSRFL